MSNPVLKTLKTGRQLMATAGIVLGAFGLPALMAGGVVLPDLIEAADVEWMGTGEDDPVVYVGIDEPGPSGKDQVDQAAVNPAPAGGAEESQPRSQESDLLQIRTERPTAENRKATTDDSPVHNAVRVDTVRNARGPAQATGYIARVKEQRERAAAARAKAKGKRCQDPVDGIEHMYGDRYTIRRDVIDHYSTVEEAMKLARVAWHKGENGKNDGFKLYRIACGSPLAQVGMRSGDVVHTINGKNVRTLPQAFAAVRKVKRKDSIYVEFSRGGEMMTRMVTVE